MPYNKLVRDYIPQLIKSKGQNPVTRILDDTAYSQALKKKLQEEVDEYLDAKTPQAMAEELADILEVVRALCALAGTTPKEIDKLRAKKTKERGGFGKRIFLTDVTD